MCIKKTIIVFMLALVMLMLNIVPVPAQEKSDPAANAEPTSYTEESMETIAEELKGKSIAVLTGSTCEQIAEKYFTESKHVFYDTIADAYLALQTHKVDAYLENEPGLSYLSSVRNDAQVIVGDLPAEQMSTMFVKNDKGRMLQSQYNDYVKRLYAEGRIDALKQKWVYGPEEGRQPVEYKDLPDINGTLRISTDPTFPPFEYLKDNGLAGYEIDLVTDFCREYGYRPEYEIVSFAGSISGVFTGKYDMAVSGLSITPERQERALFGDVIYDCKVAVALLKEQEATGIQGFFKGLSDGFKSTFIKEDRWKMFGSGILVTLAITFSSIILGSLIGFGVYILTRRNNKLAIKTTSVCKTVIQGFPMVVFLMVMYYLVFGKSRIDAIWVSVIAFSLTFACSVHSIMEQGEKAVDYGQKEAAYSLGYRENQAFFRYVLPQSAMYFFPNYRDEMINHLKATAIVGYVAVVDITKVGDIIRGRTYDALFPLLAVSLAYFGISFIIKKAMDAASHSMDPKNRTEEEILKGLVIR